VTRILVVDDQNHVRAAIVLALESQFEAVAVASAEAGLRELEQSRFDLIIVDIYMPGIDGVQFIKMVREKDPDISIIAMSGVQMRASGRTALDFFPLATHTKDIERLQKPFRSAELFQAVLKVTRGAKKKSAGAAP
jgi:CheY-like chemotaxis protein